MDKRLPGIQAGRAIAALSVFYFHSYIALGYFDKSKLHTNAWLAAHGANGVELFFAISGFIVCYIAGRPDFRARDFLLKRFFRIYPLNAVVTLAIMWIVLKEGIAIADPFGKPQIIDSFLILPQQKPINSVGWTLEFEMAFYFLSAVLIPIGGRRLLLLYCLISGALGQWFLPHTALLARLIHAHYLDFGAGILAYFVFERLTFFTGAMQWSLSVGFFAAAALIYQLGFHFTPFYVEIACLAAVIALALIPWAPSWLVKLGDISYGIYLIHWPVICLMGWAAFNVHPNPTFGEIWRWQALLYVWLLASLSWTYFERPLNRLIHRVISERPSIDGIGKLIPGHNTRAAVEDRTG